MNQTKIEWADSTWNPVTGCSTISEGCQNCYAERMATRLRGRFGYPADNPFAVTIHKDKFGIPLKTKKPTRFFVCSMGDLFHNDVPFIEILKIFNIMHQCPQHTFMLLTKRPRKMLDFAIKYGLVPYNSNVLQELTPSGQKWPDNVWAGVTCENQQRADERIPILSHIPSAVRFISVEPMLSTIDLSNIMIKIINQLHAPAILDIDWVICGGETGPNARPMHPEWVHKLRDQCNTASTPFYFKGWGEWEPGSINITTGNLIFRSFPNKLKWIHKGDTWVNGGICLDMDGKTVTRGLDFDTARYPIAVIHRVGKKRSGRILDGQQWSQTPKSMC